MPAEAIQKRTAEPWLAALVPSHNGSRWLAAALESAVAQNDPGLEVILLDSSATGQSLEIAEGFADRLDIRIERRPDLPSWQAKTNAAAAMARAPWLCMLHQDDLWLPGRASALRGWIAETPDAIMHLHPAYIVDGETRRLGVWRCPLAAGDQLAEQQQAMFERLLVQNFIAIPAPAFRRDIFLAVGGLDEQLWYTADWDLYLKTLRQGSVRYHDTVLAAFRIHRNSLTSTGSRSLAEFRRQMQTVLDRHIGKLDAGQRQTRRLAAVSIDINVALAALAHGRVAPLLEAIGALVMLGPRQVCRYLTYSRLFERILPRLRARLAGTL